jgi:hypothetical protein
MNAVNKYYVVEDDAGFMVILDNTELEMGMNVLYQSTDIYECFNWAKNSLGELDDDGMDETD